jgi:hypothetical protein
VRVCRAHPRCIDKLYERTAWAEKAAALLSSAGFSLRRKWRAAAVANAWQSTPPLSSFSPMGRKNNDISIDPSIRSVGVFLRWRRLKPTLLNGAT